MTQGLPRAPVLIADWDPARVATLRRCLEPLAVNACTAWDESAARRAKDNDPAVVVLGSPPLGTAATISAVKGLREICPAAKVILLAGQSSEETAIEALRAGVNDYFRSPVLVPDVAKCVLRLLPPTNNRPNRPLEIVGRSSSIQRVRDLMQRVSPSEATVLIMGETGTGKELIANGIHTMSKRSSRPLVSSNCSAIPDTLVESELFGHDKGAFTGAVASQHGLFMRAHTGTLFLDEIGEMSALAQAKILRAIETGEIQPLGAHQPVRVDIRIIAATHRDLNELMSDNSFRRDLFFRLSVIPIQIPPLRERRGDIPDLVQHFIDDLNERYHRDIEGISPAALKLLCEEDWPGNIRQLRNVIQAAFLVSGDHWITERDLRELHWNTASSTRRMIVDVPQVSAMETGSDSEMNHYLRALQATSWNKSQAAQRLGCSRMTVYRKVSQYSLAPEL